MLLCRAVMAVGLVSTLLGPVRADEIAFTVGWLHEYFAEFRGDYIRSGRVWEQTEETLIGRYPDVQLPSGEYLISGCRPHSCTEKAAVVLSPSGNPIVVGLINSHCSESRCEHLYEGLTVFVKADTPHAAVRIIEGWADGLYPPGDLVHELAAETEIVVVR